MKRLLAVALLLSFCSTALAQEQFSDKQVCMAALTTILQLSKHPKGGQSKIGRYVKAEGKKHTFKSAKGEYKCTLIGNKVMWGNKDGRWRNDPADEAIVYSVAGNQLVISQIFTDGSKIDEKFTQKRIQSLF